MRKLPDYAVALTAFEIQSLAIYLRQAPRFLPIASASTSKAVTASINRAIVKVDEAAMRITQEMES